MLLLLLRDLLLLQLLCMLHLLTMPLLGVILLRLGNGHGLWLSLTPNLLLWLRLLLLPHGLPVLDQFRPPSSPNTPNFVNTITCP